MAQVGTNDKGQPTHHVELGHAFERAELMLADANALQFDDEDLMVPLYQFYFFGREHVNYVGFEESKCPFMLVFKIDLFVLLK